MTRRLVLVNNMLNNSVAIDFFAEQSIRLIRPFSKQMIKISAISFCKKFFDFFSEQSFKFNKFCNKNFTSFYQNEKLSLTKIRKIKIVFSKMNVFPFWFHENGNQ